MERAGTGTCPPRDRLPALVNGHLPEEETEALRSHVADCAACRAAEARYRRLTSTLQAMPPLAAPVGLRERILAGAAAEADDQRRLGRGLGLRLALASVLLMIAVGAGFELRGRRFGGLTPSHWLQAARETADRAYSVRVTGWIETPNGRVPVEASRVGGTVTRRIGSRVEKLAGISGFWIWDLGLSADQYPIQYCPTPQFATWRGAAGSFDYGEPLLLLAAPNARPSGPPRFHSRVPLVIAIPLSGSLVERVWIDPESKHVRRAELVGEDGKPRAALERLEYNPYPGLFPEGRALN